MKKILVIIVSIYVALVIFMPKEQILYTALNKSDKKLKVFVEQTNDFGIFEYINGVKVGYDGLDLVKIDNIKIFPFLFYNYSILSTIEPTDSLKSMLNLVVLKATVTNSVINPMKLNINAKTTIGDVKGSFDISTSKLKIFITPNKEFKSFKYKNYLKKQKEGYSYESIIR